MLIDEKCFVDEKNHKIFRVFLRKIEKKLKNIDFNKIKDTTIQKELKEMLNTYEGELPKLNSVTKGEAKDYLVFDNIQFESSEKEVKLTFIFSSELDTEGSFSFSFPKEIFEKKE